MACLRFGVLGSLEVWRQGQRIEVGAAKQRAVLALLLLRAGRTVSTEQLFAAVWDAEPPATALRTLRSLISRLRRTLACGAGAVLLRQASGYRLAVAPDRVDAHRFERLVTDAGEAIGQGRVGEAAAGLRHALGLWRGAALADVPRTSIIEAEAVRLEERRHAALDSRVDADLWLGRHAELVGELQAATTSWPLRERSWEQLMLALYRSGRRADALGAYRRVRAMLRTELGVEPGPTLQDLHRRVLATDSALATPPAPAPAGPPATAHTPPRQLPADVAGFAGRAAHLARLDRLLPETGGPAHSVVISAIAGTAGVGKTALAVHWAHRVRDQFPDGQLFVDLRGYASGAPALPPIEALARFLAALGMPAERVPTRVDEAAAAYRSLLSDRRVLVVLDNAASPDQVRPLLPGGAGCAVLVTSRDRLDGLVARDGAHRLSLDVLSPEDARGLLTGCLGTERAQAEPAALGGLADLCGYLPLALRIAAAQLSAHPWCRIADQVARLRRPDRVAALAVPGDPTGSVSAAFDLSYTRLPDAPRRMFRLLGLVPGPDLTVMAAASLAGTAPARAGQLLRALVAAHLVEEHAPGRYTCHDLLRRYAVDRVEQEEHEADRRAARDRLYDFYVRTTDTAADTLFPWRLRLPRAEATGPVPVAASFENLVAARRWLDAERANLTAATQYAAAHGRRWWAWTIADDLRYYFWLRTPAAEWAATARAGLTAAEAAGDLRAQVAGHLSLAALYSRQARHRDAAGHGGTALTLAHRSDWIEGQVAAHVTLGTTYARTGDFHQGAAQFRRGIALAEQVGWRHGQAAALTNLGSMYVEMGRLSQAAEHAGRGLAINVGLGTSNGQAINLTNLGAVHYLAGRLDQAGVALHQAQALCQAIGNSSSLCTARRWLAALHLAVGRYHRACRLASSAVALARDKGHSVLEADALVVVAAVHERLGQHRQALDAGQRALELAEPADAVTTPAEARMGLATVHLRIGEREQAHGYAVQALAAAREVGLRLLEAQALTVLATVRLAYGAAGQATTYGEQALAIHRETGHRLGQAHTDLVLGRARAQAGDHRAARHHWQDAYAAFTEIGTPPAAEAAATLLTPAEPTDPVPT